MTEEFTFTWAKPEFGRMPWRRDRWHGPDALTTFAADSVGIVRNGFARGMAATGAPFTMDFQVINGYLYLGVGGPPQPGGLQPLGAEPQPARMANHKAWDEIWLPEIQAYLTRWAAFDRQNATAEQLGTHIEESLLWAERCWEIHARLDFSVEGMLTFAAAELGWDVPKTQRMLAGLSSKSLESDEAMRKLADLVRGSTTLSDAFTGNAPAAILPALPANGDGAKFRAELAAFLEAFGKRFDNEFDSSSRSWVEDPTPVLAVVRAYVSQPLRDHQAMRDKLAQDREDTIAEARRLLAGRPQDVRETFEQELGFAQRSAELNETHNFWLDQQVAYWTQQNFLAAGRMLAGHGVIETARDVFHLHIAEVLDALRGSGLSLKPAVAARKADMVRFEAMEAPLELGAPAPPEVSAMLDSLFGGHKRSEVSTEVHGQGSSSGVATGTARIILTLNDSDRIEEGDILVTKTTSPPWTPLFGIVSAVVTDAGGALSHCAIVAREYAIPAVVGCVDATVKIADGARIRVDGDTGIVTLL